MIPTIGRTVIYKTTAEDRKKLEPMSKNGLCNIQKELPAIIVAVWGDDETSAVNLKVFIDGESGCWWVTSRSQGTEEGEWHFPKRVNE